MRDFNATHKGLFCGFVPVYLNMADPEWPEIVARHPVFEPLLDIADLGIRLTAWVISPLFGVMEVSAPVRVTGKIEQ